MRTHVVEVGRKVKGADCRGGMNRSSFGSFSWTKRVRRVKATRRTKGETEKYWVMRKNGEVNSSEFKGKEKRPVTGADSPMEGR